MSSREPSDPAAYGDAWADVYDTRHAQDPARAAEVLARLAAGGPALEPGIGTGRVALALQARGVDVQGIDASHAMVARLREKEGGDRIPVVIGDFADIAVEGSFSVVYAAFSTLFALVTKEAQARCFAGVRARLRGGGAFVVEAFVPDPERHFPGGQVVRVHRVEPSAVEIEVALCDTAAQRVSSQWVTLAPGGVTMRPLAIRYAWPEELDTMAEAAGLRLESRWADWSARAFDGVTHVSVYRAGP